MYTSRHIQDNITGAEKAAVTELHRYGIEVYVEAPPDICGPSFAINSADTKGIEIFRNFCQQMLEHYKSINTKP